MMISRNFKKKCLIATLLSILLAVIVVFYITYQKKNIRVDFYKAKNLAEMFLYNGNYTRIKNERIRENIEAYNLEKVFSKQRWFTPMVIIETSPDYNTILQTGLYLDNGTFYNLETLLDHIDTFSPTFDLDEIILKGWNRYDICVSGTFNYSGSYIEISGVKVNYARGPFRIGACYPIDLSQK